MYKQGFLYDSDALIKLMKATLLKIFAENFECIITQEIEKEVVTAGKKSLHSDAEEIEKLIEEKILIVKEVQESKNNDPRFEKLGKGEISLYELRKAKKNMIIISDDRTFVNKIREERIAFITSLDCIKLAFELNIINKKAARQKLENIKQYCNEIQYQKIRKEIGDENDHNTTDTAR